MATHSRKTKFTPAVMVKPRDSLGVTKFRPFRPTTYCENEHNMFDLMSFHYQRLWTKDKDEYFKKYDVTKEKAESALLRRCAPKHQHNVPRLAVPRREPVKLKSKYDHVRPRYLDYGQRPRDVAYCRKSVGGQRPS